MVSTTLNAIPDRHFEVMSHVDMSARSGTPSARRIAPRAVVSVARSHDADDLRSVTHSVRMTISSRLTSLGILLPEVFPPGLGRLFRDTHRREDRRALDDVSS